MNIFVSILLYIVGTIVILYIRKKSDQINNQVEKHIPPFISMPISFFLINLVIRFLGYPKDIVGTKLIWTIIIEFIYLFMIVLTVWGAIESISEYTKSKRSFFRLITNFLMILFSLSFSFFAVYFIIYDLYPESFINVLHSNLLQTSIDLFCYSFGIMTTIGGSNVLANNVIAKLFTIIEMTTSFLFIIILIANYKEIGNIYNNKK